MEHSTGCWEMSWPRILLLWRISQWWSTTVLHNGRQKSRRKSHKSAWWLSSLGNELSTGARGNDFKVLFIFLSCRATNIHRYSQNLPSVALRSTADDTLLELCLVVNFKKSLLIKGQLISKSLFGVFTFFQKTNENKSTNSETNLFVCLWKKCRHEKIILNLSDL